MADEPESSELFADLDDADPFAPHRDDESDGTGEKDENAPHPLLQRIRDSDLLFLLIMLAPFIGGVLYVVYLVWLKDEPPVGQP